MGSAPVSRAADCVLAIANFLKDCFGETPKPTRETRALPNPQKILVCVKSSYVGGTRTVVSQKIALPICVLSKRS
ncbi:MAG: hypothetical protein DMF19_08735 [Verrucomicrobia bacterium]|nr:MAG: hypothetical protein DMF19_08735 [Verrucomicrobiota bacterium]